MTLSSVRNCLAILTCTILFPLCLFCGANNEELFISGLINIENVETAISGPIMVAVTTTDDINAIEQYPQTAILAAYGVDRKTPFYHADLGDTGLSAGDSIYVFAFVDNDFDGLPSPSAGDFIGNYINSNNYSMQVTLHRGENGNINININRQIREFDASIIYAIDRGEVTYGPDFNTLTTEEVIVAVHEDGVNVSLTSSGETDVKIDPDYIMAITRYQPPEYDCNSITDPPRPKPFANGRTLEIIPAIHVKIPIENGQVVGGVYLFAIIDENSDGEIDQVNDDIGYVNEEQVEDGSTCYTIPGQGEYCIPSGTYYYPRALTIAEGENRDADNDDEPYWIMYKYADLN